MFETPIEIVVWVSLLPLVLVGGTPVILVRAPARIGKFFSSLTGDYRALFRWWWDHHPFS